MAKMGRPTIEIDWEQFEKLCQIHCTREEIAGVLKCSEDTIERRVKEKFGKTFAAVFKEMSALGRVSLRRKQFEMAASGDRTMLVWLGKQVLGQVDNIEHRLKREEEAVKELTDEQLLARAKEVLPILVETVSPARPDEDVDEDS